MTTKTFIRLTILSLTLTTGVILFSTFHNKTQAAATGEDGIQCKEKSDGTCTKSDNTAIWESISRHLLGTNQ
ncbi:MAG TPA: hypothetical protein VGM41_13710 [Chitinophagaceae bacterium]